jgi:hypothetical protein
MSCTTDNCPQRNTKPLLEPKCLSRPKPVEAPCPSSHCCKRPIVCLSQPNSPLFTRRRTLFLLPCSHLRHLRARVLVSPFSLRYVSESKTSAVSNPTVVRGTPDIIPLRSSNYVRAHSFLSRWLDSVVRAGLGPRIGFCMPVSRLCAPPFLGFPFLFALYSIK